MPGLTPKPGVPPERAESLLAQRVVAEVEKAGMPARVGIAGSKLAARVAASLPDSPKVVGEGKEAEAKPPTTALTDTPPVVPAKIQGLDLGPACSQCGGMMQRTGSCYTCSSCGNNTGCG